MNIPIVVTVHPDERAQLSLQNDSVAWNMRTGPTGLIRLR